MFNYRALAIGAAVLTAFATGRWFAPTKVITETKTVTVEVETKDTKNATSVDKDRDRHVERETIEVVRPDGTRETKTRVVENSSTDTHRVSSTTESTTSSSTNERDTRTETTRESGRVNLSVLGGIKLNDFAAGPKIGGHVSRNILGPITLGVWGMNDLTFGASVGLSF